MTELPGWRGPADDPARVITQVDAWATAPALLSLAASFGGLPSSTTPEQLLAWLDEFSAAHWDFRGGRERNLADEALLSVEQERLVFELAPALGLAGVERPSRERYDTVLMTGGMVRAGIVKPRQVAELLAGGLEVGRVVFLGGFRPFAGDETALAAELGVRGDNEFAAMVAGMELAFGPLGEPSVEEFAGENENVSWREYGWSAQGVSLAVLAAPSSDPLRRANSADTYRFWAEHRRGERERSVLVVTTPIYVPYQGAAAVEVLGLGYDLAVETVGTGARANDLGEFSQAFRPAHHLQELRSAIRALRSLRAALVQRARQG